MKDPAFLFYSSDFLTGTMLMDNEQKGKYITLMCLQHQKGHLTEKDMLKICVTYDEDIYNKFKIDDDGKYYNERLEMETKKRFDYSESRRKNRLKKTDDKSEHMNNICETYEAHMENENVNINENINTDIDITKKEVKKDVLFEQFWQSYPKKKAKPDALKAWKKLSVDDTVLAKMIQSIETSKKTLDWKKDKGQYIPYPATWLNQRRWEDEVEKKTKWPEHIVRTI